MEKEEISRNLIINFMKKLPKNLEDEEDKFRKLLDELKENLKKLGEWETIYKYHPLFRDFECLMLRNKMIKNGDWEKYKSDKTFKYITSNSIF